MYNFIYYVNFDNGEIMKKIILSMFLVFSISNNANATNANTDLILQEISQLRFDMNKRFEQVDKRFEQIDRRFEQVDKRFEQVNKRFEQTDKRLDFLQQLFYVLMALIFASPFLAFYLKEKSQGRMQSLIFALREAAQEDKNLAKALKIAGLNN
jgi:tetrahydromethanopterin S-methyltransferase subunit G